MGLLRVGLTGGMGCGKSLVARELQARYKVAVVDMDEAGREAVERPDAQAELRRAFPASLFQPCGRLDRRALGRLVFSDAAQRARLNTIVHPIMLEIVREKMDAAERRKVAPPYVVVDAALIFELGFDEELDAVVTVYAPLHLCLQRAQKRSGLTLAEVQARVRAQMPVAEKIRRADYRLNNGGSRQALRQRVDALHSRLLQLAAQKTPLT